ncbi:hypothetical protein BKA70DRAFT_1120837 [Coprinopsis sp. MPI-PUGE-AT-0042]|nr:hypothetical protein BKA70DRAFT_1120837 [Coprinopsis sp. MPI-PUGE-AT-0042]
MSEAQTPNAGKRRPKQTSSTPKGWRRVKSKKSRSIYGTGIKIFPRVDVITPVGSFTQGREANSSTAASSDPVPDEPSVSTSNINITPKESQEKEKVMDKRTRQITSWIEKTIPALVQPFLDLLHASNNLRSIDRSHVRCRCSRASPRVRVLCVEFGSMYMRNICSCSITSNLINVGFFPSTPIRPTVTFDIKMLSFMHELHVRCSPNISGWSSALETFLQGLGFSLASTDSLRRKIATSLRWYRFLLATKDLLIGHFIKLANAVDSSNVTVESDSEVEDHGPGVHYDGASSGCGEEWQDEGADNPLPAPDEYLQEACPLCFGGDSCFNPALVADVIVSLDANFTQKRRKPARGDGREPPFTHPNTAWLSEKEAGEAKAYVEQLRPPKAPKDPSPPSDDSNDYKEPGMKVPASVLDGCLDSFTAADEKRVKANPHVFADTGIMALLCRHDQPLWLVNMTTAGERQFYAIALLIKLFAHLPPSTRVGVLYDISCQLERSCLQWGFLSEFMDRMVFAVSVFHAYGHRWPCQLIYHPRKCAGFGLSDGEGCERFWSMIKFLIPSLRVSGYHQRRFVLDIQISHIRGQSLEALGSWIVRRWKAAMTRSSAAVDALATLPWSTDDYEREQGAWKSQVAFQTQPLTRVSKNAGKKAIEDIITLSKLREVFKSRLNVLEQAIISGNRSSNIDLDDLLSQRVVLQAKLLDLEHSLKKKTSRLDIDDKANLKALLSSRFMALRVNAQAIKERLLAKLCNHKFEMQRLEKAVRLGGSSEQKLTSHVKTQLRKQQPGILNLVKRYNTMATEINDLILRKRSPANARPLPLVDRSSIFKLDVDDPIWDNSPFDDSVDDVPLWMGNDEMRKGIRLNLEVSRCAEELARLHFECENLQSWARQQWMYVQNANLKYKDNPGLAAEISRKSASLLRLIATWSSHLKGLDLPSTFNHAQWGPLPSEVEEAVMMLLTTQLADSEVADDDDEEEECVDGDGAGVTSDLWDVLDLIEHSELTEEGDPSLEPTIYGKRPLELVE